jgi:hypothetical protein
MKELKSISKQVQRELYNMFLPNHERLGIDNAITIHEIAEHINKKFKIMTEAELKNEIIRFYYFNHLQSWISTSIRNPKSKLYLKGLSCLQVDGKKPGNYFYPENFKEYGDVSNQSLNKLAYSERKTKLRLSHTRERINRLIELEAEQKSKLDLEQKNGDDEDETEN